MIFIKNPGLPQQKSKEIIKFYQEYCHLWNLSVIKPLYAEITNASLGIIDLEEKFHNKHLTIELLSKEKIKYPFVGQKNINEDVFGHSICVSINNEVAHGRPKGIFKGDSASIDCGISLPFKDKRLMFDAAFTTICGNRCEDLGWVKEPHKALQNIIREQPKNTKEISEIIEQTALDAGLQVVVATTGHGIGHQLHEAPPIYNASGQFQSIDLFEGLVFCIEPIFVNPGKNKVSSSIAATYIKEDGWTITTTSGDPASHFESMFAIINGQIVDLLGMTEWSF
jgi:methionyl aminopeptidase